MVESLDLYRQLSPVQVGLLLFPVGLVVGSFTSVIWQRVRQGGSIVGPRSHCHACRHPLGARDLVPLVSFFLLQGRCRFCRASIPWRYPVLEAGCGGLAALFGAYLGWDMGLLSLLLWVGGVGALAGLTRRRAQESGTTLVEVVIAVGLLAAVAIPMLDFGANMRGATPFERQIAISLATGKLEELGNVSYRVSNTNGWPPSDHELVPIQIGRYFFDIEWTVTPYLPDNNDFPAENGHLRQAVVIVTCQNCLRPMPAVRMVGLLAKLPPP